MERPRIVPILNRLEELKFAQRLVCDADKRNRRIVLTAKGARVLQELKRRFAEHEKALVQLLGRSKPLVLMDLHRLCTLRNS